MARKNNPAEPLLDQIDLRMKQIRLVDKLKINMAEKRGGLNEYMRRTKSAGN